MAADPTPHEDPSPPAEHPSSVTLHVDDESAGARLDRYLADHILGVSRAAVQKWIAEDRVLVDGIAARASTRLAPGQRVDVSIPPPPRFALLPENLSLAIIYEDDDLAVIDKPAGMVVHPAAGHWEGTLLNALLARYPQLEETAGLDDDLLTQQPPRPGIVHRLDKDTSGLLIIAKTPRVAELLQAQFQARQIHKTYLALVHGVPKAPAGRIDAPIGRDPKERKRMTVTHAGRPAQTSYQMIESYHAYALLEVHPHTGRTHQIRVHLAFIGHPIIGDELYGRRKGPVACPRQFLHAWRLAFAHPLTGAKLNLEAPLPSDLRHVLEMLRPAGY